MDGHETTLLNYYILTPPLTISATDHSGTNNHTSVVSSASNTFIWKRYQTYSDLATLRYEHDLLRWLVRQELPFAVPEPLADRDGATLTPNGIGWQALFLRLRGSAPDRDSAAVVEAAGAALAELHKALSSYPMHKRPGIAGYADLGAVHQHITNPWSLTPADLGLPDQSPQQELFAWWRNELAALQSDIKCIYPTLPHQVIHGDFALGNTLFLDDQLTAILDFEFACPDARAIDVASGLYSILRIWTHSDRMDLAKALCRGYGSRMRLTSDEITALPFLMRLREAVSTIWWLGRGVAANNPAEQTDGIERMKALVTWLDQHGTRLVATVRPHLA